MKGPVEELGARTVLLGDENREVEGIYGNRQEQRILAATTGLGFDEYNMVGEDNVKEFVDTYPTPMDFAGASERFLQMIHDNNSEQKYQEYVKSMDNFQRKIYGRKYSYYLASKEEQGMQGERLSEEAIDVEPQPVERAGALRIGEKIRGLLRRRRNEQPAISEATPMPELSELEWSAEGDQALYRLSNGESKEMMGRAVMEGAPLRELDGREKTYTVDDLREVELEPKYGLRLDDVDFGFSETFKIGSRDAVIAYVSKDGGSAYVRGYYRSNSQGVWRYLPDRSQKPNNMMDWYGKGPGEEALTLPSEIQAYLNKIDKERVGDAPIGNNDADRERAVKRYRAFFGTAGSIGGSGRSYEMANYLARTKGSIDDALSREVSPKPSFTYDLGLAPEQMTLGPDFSPDYSREVSSYEAHSDKYGDYTARTFLSRGGKLKWTIMEDKQGRAWVGQVEVPSPITSTGLRSQWVSAGNLAMPLYEYRDQDEGYGDYSDTQGEYVSMWKNYLSKIPMIREYKARQSRGDGRSA